MVVIFSECDRNIFHVLELHKSVSLHAFEVLRNSLNYINELQSTWGFIIVLEMKRKNTF